MASTFHTHLAFHLRGQHDGSPLAPLESYDLRPAVLAEYRNLSELRYDYPLVLGPDGSLHSLSGVFDGLLAEVAAGDGTGRCRRLALRLEQKIRELVWQGAQGSLAELWSVAAFGLPGEDAVRQDTLDRLRAALAIDGDVVDCRVETPARVMVHLWRAGQRAKAARLHRELALLIHGVSEILEADSAASAAARTADCLRASFGPADDDAIDFESMARVLHPAARGGLTPAHRDRILSMLRVLQTQRFFPFGDDDAYVFEFDRCAPALEAYWTRQGVLTDLARAMAAARLEIAGAWDDAAHDIVSTTMDRTPIDPAVQALLPDYLVLVDAGRFDPAEQAALLDMLSAGLPMKVLIRTDDVLDASARGPSHFGFGFTSRQLVNTAVGLNDVFVLQTPVSHLLTSADDIRSGLAFAGPSVFSVFSGAGGHADLPPYLVAAAALESRAFPAFVCNPSAGTDRAARFSIAGSPEPEADWPTHGVTYETAGHQAARVDVPFTFVDFVLCDGRFSSHFARADSSGDPAHLMTVPEALAGGPADRQPERVPAVTAVDRANRLTPLIVDNVLVQQARRCRDLWRRLQQLASVGEAETGPIEGSSRAERVSPREPSGDPGVPASERVGGAEGAEPPGPFIETPRCSTCDHCTQVNSRMFAYNENRQAFIADAAAGTYRQLVEAAEGCQVAVIHPGRPRDLNEPGLDELLQRAAAFL